MTEVKINMRELKASIADVLPVMKVGAKQHVPLLAHAAVVSDGETVRFEATDRFCVVYSTFAWADGDERFPEFRTFVDVDTLTALKGYGTMADLRVDGEGFVLRRGDDATRFSVSEPGDWPDLKYFVDDAWGDEDYFTPGEETEPAAVNPMIVKHIKDVQIIPRLNKTRRQWRIQARGRVKGIIMPLRHEVGE